MISDGKPILDVCCGSRMFWFDHDNPLADFMDIRDEDCYQSDGQLIMVHPNIIGDFTAIPKPDKSYKLVVFDPPHLLYCGTNSDMYKAYGRLDRSCWKETLRKGYTECMRILDDFGILIFKWNENDVKVRDVIKAIGEIPLFGHRTRRHTIWLCYMKISHL